MNRLNIQVEFKPRRSKPVAIPVVFISRGDTAVIILNQSALWKHHYNQAVSNGNSHVAAVRFASLMER